MEKTMIPEYMKLNYLEAPSWFQYGFQETGTHTHSANDFVLFIQTTKKWVKYQERMFLKVDKKVNRTTHILQQPMGFTINLDRETGGVYSLNDINWTLQPKVAHMIRLVEKDMQSIIPDFKLSKYDKEDIENYMLRTYLEWAWKDRNNAICQALYCNSVHEYITPETKEKLGWERYCKLKDKRIKANWRKTCSRK